MVDIGEGDIDIIKAPIVIDNQLNYTFLMGFWGFGVLGFWELLGGLGAILGGLGGLLGGLRPAWVHFFCFKPNKVGSGAQRLQKRDPTWHPKCDPKRTKIEDKNEDEKRHRLRSSWVGLGAILGRSWAPPISKIVLPPRAGSFFWKFMFSKK